MSSDQRHAWARWLESWALIMAVLSGVASELAPLPVSHAAGLLGWGAVAFMVTGLCLFASAL